jgi:long-subunit fatty acid transport protein
MTCIYVVGSIPSYGQIASPIPPKPDYDNSVSLGISYGFQNARDAEFVGWSAEYSRILGGNWILGGALAWDTETERKENQQDSVKDTYTLIATLGYSFAPLVTISAGFGKGIADDDNKDNSMRFNLGDNHVGVVLGIVLPVFPTQSPYSMGFSTGYEYNLSQEESNFSFDLGIGRSF